jgi:surfeit locus 1 family protein
VNSAAVQVPRWRAFIAPGLATLVALAILVSLGTWQLERRAWKENLIAQIQARAHGEPGAIAPEAQWPAWRAADNEFCRVRVVGTFLHDREVLVHGLMAIQRGAPAQGFYVFTPLRLPDGAVVFINRGFAPTELKDPQRRADGATSGEVTVTGLVRAPEARSAFVPANDAVREQWFVRDPAEMARARALPRVAPFYVEADATANPGGWPRGGQANLTLPNNHLHFAFPWVGLALTLVGVSGAWVWRQTRPPAR